jgi:hypothetical protein
MSGVTPARPTYPIMAWTGNSNNRATKNKCSFLDNLYRMFVLPVGRSTKTETTDHKLQEYQLSEISPTQRSSLCMFPLRVHYVHSMRT